MATVAKKPNGIKEVRYNDQDGRPRSIYPGKVSLREAQGIGQKVDHIVARQVLGREPDTAVNEWLAGLGGKLYGKLASAGLAPPREDPEAIPVPRLGQFLDDYIAIHAGNDLTKEQLTITARALKLRLGANRELGSVTAADAEKLRNWMLKHGNETSGYERGLAENTVRRRMGRCKQFFNFAIKSRYITDNPFKDEKAAVSGSSEDRLFFVPADWIEKIIRETTCESWKIILALARYAGVRSGETRMQKWEHVHWGGKGEAPWIMIMGTKTKPRRVPISPELMRHLRRAKEMAPEGAVYLQDRYAPTDNIATEFGRMITRAGYTPWPKPWQNIRSTRETEWCRTYPMPQVVKWIGNSISVAAKHYLQQEEATFAAATRGFVYETAETAGPNPPQNPPHAVQHQPCQENTPESQDAEFMGNDAASVVRALAALLQGCPTRTRT